MEERDWLIVQELYKYKNITKTANSLFMSQPALTARLQHIEREFGVTIVERTRKGVHFTPQGEYLAKNCTEVLQSLIKIKEKVINLGGMIAGTLRLGASSYITMYTLPRLLKHFRLKYPAVEFKVTTTWSKEIFNLVHNQEVHVGFISSDYGWHDKKHLLFEEAIYVAATDEFDLANLPNLPRINYNTDALIKNMIDQWWRENFNRPPAISMEVDKLYTCKEMVRNGLGYAIMPARILSDMGTLHKVMLTDRSGKPLLRKTWMIYHKDSLETDTIREFVEFVRQMDFNDPS